MLEIKQNISYYITKIYLCQEVSEMKIYYDRSNSERSEQEMNTYAYLDGLDIEYTRVDHDAAATIADCELVDGELGTKMCKNLFLCNSPSEPKH